MLEPMNHDTAILTILQGLGGNDSITHRGGGLSSGKRHNSGSNMAPPSRRPLSSTSPQVAGSFSRRDLSPERKTSLQSQETVEL